MSDGLSIDLPAELVETIAKLAAEFVLAEQRGPRWATLEEAAEHLRTTAGALRWRAQHGRLPGAVKDEGRWIVDLTVLDDTLSSQTATTLRALNNKRGSRRANDRSPGTGGTSSHAR